MATLGWGIPVGWKRLNSAPLVGVAPYVAMSIVAWKKYKAWRGKR